MLLNWRDARLRILVGFLLKSLTLVCLTTKGRMISAAPLLDQLLNSSGGLESMAVKSESCNHFKVNCQNRGENTIGFYLGMPGW